MKKHLISESGNFYKANLHCHTTLSDGRLTPEEIKKYYTDAGYSIVAFTDHDKYIKHNELSDAAFLALNGFEADISRPHEISRNLVKCWHLNFYDTNPDRRTEVNIPFPYAPYKETKKIMEYVKSMVEEGFIVSYNHPHWSMQNLDDYRHIEGIFALEIFNFGTYQTGHAEETGCVYDDLLRMGKRIYCTATDDNHNRHEFGSPYWDSFGGFTMIKAESLNYENIINSLKNGNFYASRAPEIKELYIEDSVVHIKCSPVSSIAFINGGRNHKRIFPASDEKLSEAEFPVNAEDIYFRLELVDAEGKKAFTNAYFLDEI